MKLSPLSIPLHGLHEEIEEIDPLLRLSSQPQGGLDRAVFFLLVPSLVNGRDRRMSFLTVRKREGYPLCLLTREDRTGKERGRDSPSVRSRPGKRRE